MLTLLPRSLHAVQIWKGTRCHGLQKYHLFPADFESENLVNYGRYIIPPAFFKELSLGRVHAVVVHFSSTFITVKLAPTCSDAGVYSAALNKEETKVVRILTTRTAEIRKQCGCKSATDCGVWLYRQTSPTVSLGDPLDPKPATQFELLGSVSYLLFSYFSTTPGNNYFDPSYRQ